MNMSFHKAMLLKSKCLTDILKLCPTLFKGYEHYLNILKPLVGFDIQKWLKYICSQAWELEWVTEYFLLPH